MSAKPSRREKEAARAATIGVLLEEGARRLAEARVPEARRDARLLIAHALGARPELVLAHPERKVSGAASAHISRLIELRAERRPLAQIIGVREFWSLPFAVTADTLDPRPDSETLVEAALEGQRDRAAPLRVLDLGTGTGCLLLAVLSELPRAEGIGVDVSEAACRVARRNARALGLARRAAFVVADWGRPLAGSFDLVLANPPYVPEHEIDGLEPEVARFEPRRALSGGGDGLACYRALAPELARLLTSGGRAVLEIGAGQAAAVKALLRAHGMVWISSPRDLAGRVRCLVVGRARATWSAAS